MIADRPEKTGHMEESPDEPGAEEERRTAGAIGRSAERKLKARSTRERGVWFGLGMFGLVGWAVAIPTLIGVALGLWLDARFESERSWTLALLLAGIALGCLNAWYWVSRESRHD
ncbi:MAG: AtpZ/AtpI family protein [Alphaproteobacteria bacterium]